MSSLSISRGRRFGCTACGNCCVQDGYVFVDDAEIARMAAYLGKTVGEFWRDHGVFTHPEEEVPVLEARDGRGCPLLTEDRKCSVHPVKPSQCKTWPFWSDMIEDAQVWEAAKSYCPGLDAKGGTLYSKRDILEIARQKRGT